MKLTASAFRVAAALCLAAPVAAQTRAVVGPYEAVVDRVTYPKPALPAIGAAGSVIADPVFQSSIRRITDANTRPGVLNRSYRTPSSPHQNAWSASGTYFYVVSGDGAIIPFAFDGGTGAARRINPTSSGAGGLVLNFYIEPGFSYVSDSIIYGSVAGGNLHTIDQYDFATGGYSRLLDLETITSGLSGTYIGGVSSSAGAVERIMVMFGGASQDKHHLVLVFDKGNPSNRLLLDTYANTINGQPTSIPLNFSLHHVAIDRSGRYIMLYPTGADQASARKAPQSVAWDTQTGTITEMPVSTLPYGHDAFGYGVSVNQDCCVSTSWDAAQWQFRNLATPTKTRDLLPKVLQPKEVYLEDHTTWNNARPDALMPVISGVFRYGTAGAAWRALDDEIVAIQTDAPGADPTIWRFAHHRSAIANDNDATIPSFWYEPRPNVSGDGHWVLFTSNWEKTLGADPTGEPGTGFRQDVFLVQLKGSGSPTVVPPSPAPPVSKPVMWIDAPVQNATVKEPFNIAGWAADFGATQNAGIDSVHVWAYPNPGSGQAPVFIGAAYGGARPDVAAAVGSQYLNSGYNVIVNGLGPGLYQFVTYAHSTVTGTFNNVRTVNVTISGWPGLMWVDSPGSKQTVGTSFVVAGWAFDPNTTSGTGVDAIHVWAYPVTGGDPVFVGVATLGYARPDVAAAFAPLFGPVVGANSGYSLAGTLPAGTWNLVVYAHSTVTNTFNNWQVVTMTVK